MTARRERTILVIAGLFLLVIGAIGGVTVDRIRFEPRRRARLAKVEAVIQANHGTPLAMGPTIRAPTPR
jgi:hypothetical protein